MKKLFKITLAAILICVTIASFAACGCGNPDLTVNKAAISSLELTSRENGQYAYKEIEPNLEFKFELSENALSGVEKWTRMFEVNKDGAYMLIADETSALWDVLGNRTYPATENSTSVVATFLESKPNYKGYWSNAQTGNNYSGTGVLERTMNFYFGAPEAGDYTVKMMVIDLTPGADLGRILTTVTKTIKVK